jgi:tRNA pseudouridine38-40 synthase
MPDHHVVVQLTADGFLRCMVRNIVGMLVEVGIGRIGFHQIRHVLETGDRCPVGKTAPAHGLFLAEVAYGPGDPGYHEKGKETG